MKHIRLPADFRKLLIELHGLRRGEVRAQGRIGCWVFGCKHANRSSAEPAVELIPDATMDSRRLGGRQRRPAEILPNAAKNALLFSRLGLA